VVKQWTAKCKELKDGGDRRLREVQATAAEAAEAAAATLAKETEAAGALKEEVCRQPTQHIAQAFGHYFPHIAV
jgi:hypothetical protein